MHVHTRSHVHTHIRWRQTICNESQRALQVNIDGYLIRLCVSGVLGECSARISLQMKQKHSQCVIQSSHQKHSYSNRICSCNVIDLNAGADTDCAQHVHVQNTQLIVIQSSCEPVFHFVVNKHKVLLFRVYSACGYDAYKWMQHILRVS